ncbi:hypothetical protein LCGC14_2335910 [marine sediment metagenome]|uniref:Uncharacterized protein n=1 Tax=marine sediment metagenome TaxID=412755 RepID=A0A0F9CDF4_9ZZZZ
MTDITLEMLTKRLEELNAAQLEALSTASSILGRIRECELMIQATNAPVEKLSSKEEAPRVPLGGMSVTEAPEAPSPKLVEDRKGL